MSKKLILCNICNYPFKRNYNLKRHQQKAHGKTDFKVAAKYMVKCSECSESFFNYKAREMHLIDCHNIYLEYEQYVFASEEDFYNWKERYEAFYNCSYYSISSSTKEIQLLNLKKFRCSRSGAYRKINTPTRARTLQAQGSRKIGIHCTSNIRVTMTDNIYCVKICKTHLGHSTDIEHLSLSKSEKQEILDLIRQGWTIRQVLERFKTPDNGQVRRINLINRNAVLNICKDFNLVPNKENQA